MPYEPLVVLHRLAPKDVSQLIQQNQPPSAVINPQRKNAHTFKKNEESNVQLSERDLDGNNSGSSLENQQESKLRVLKNNLNGIHHDDQHNDKQPHEILPKQQKLENRLKNYGGIKFTDSSNLEPNDLFNKELVVVIDNCFNEMMREIMVSTASHTKLRNNLTVASNSNSNSHTTNDSSGTSTRCPNDYKGNYVTDSVNINIVMTSKSSKSPPSTPVLEVIDKKNKEVSFNNQEHIITIEELDKQINFNKIQHDSSGLSLRTRTISSTSIPSALHQSTISTATSVQSVSSNSPIPGPRPRGRPPRQKILNHTANRKLLLQNTSKKVESLACNLELLQSQQIKLNQCNGIHDYNHDQENSDKNIDSKISESDKHSILIPDINKNEECAILDDACKKKCNARKRKQSNVTDVVCKKRLLVSNNHNDSLVTEGNSTEKSSLLTTSKDEVHYGFLASCNIGDRYQQFTDKRTPYSFFYGCTYWPTNWEYSAAALTGHVQKKASKDSLRKIRLLCSEGSTTKINSSLPPPLKSISSINKHQTSIVQRRGTASKCIQPSIEVSSGLKYPSTPPVIVKRPGRPPGKKNKLFQSVLKSNSPRKSPRQHASTLAAILSGKRISCNDKLIAQQTGQKIDLDIEESNKNSIDMDGPCILKMAVPKPEHKSGFRHYRRRQLDHQHDIIKRRRRRRRSITPPPPKLCAQQPVPQNNSINDSVVDQEMVKLRTKHVDVVRRRARDERLRAAFVCQQLHRVQEIAELNRRNLAEENLLLHNEIEHDFPILPLENNQDKIWSSIEVENDREPDNMCLQIMYEQTADKRFLRTNLTDETLQMYHQQRELALAERLTNNYYGDSVFSDFGTDMISATNKRKKKRPNMTGWPKEKRRKIIASASSISTTIDTLNVDSDVERNEEMLKRRRAAAARAQRLRRQRIKLEQLQLAAKEKVKDKVVLPKRRRGRRPGPLKKNKTTTYRRRKTSVSSNGTTASSNTSNTTTEIKEKKLTAKKQRRKRLLLENKTIAPVPESTVEPNTVVKRSCGRPRGSVGRRQRWKLQRHHQNQTSMSPEQQKENVLSQTSTESLSSSMTVVGKTTRTTVKRKRLQQQQQIAPTTVTWDVGRPKRYHSANNGRNAGGVVVEEDCCFVGSQPFEQHCPGVGGLNHNTVIENQQDQKENTVHLADL
ncbi:uncharacterized protein LOC112681899 isoform X2 [Sipha flava]|uniref:Uncharacterized protein LOC112681899 isoform X2 n=1 Tax=Sipha flava TaxID=143950 RepID=A0A8B8FCH7_9HEMI|nr:uncharacterized protein LOC112681899 isoform X2 [Sipha flava]